MKKLFIIYFSLWLCLINTCNANNITNIYNNNYIVEKETKFEKYLRIAGNIVAVIGGIIAIRNNIVPILQQINNIQAEPNLQLHNNLGVVDIEPF